MGDAKQDCRRVRRILPVQQRGTSHRITSQLNASAAQHTSQYIKVLKILEVQKLIKVIKMDILEKNIKGEQKLKL